MKVLLVVPHYHSENPKSFYFLSFGIMYVSAFLKEKGFEVHTLNLNHYPPGKLEETLFETAFDAVLTGGIQVHLKCVKEVVDTVKQHDPSILTIAGGPMVTSHPEFVVDYLGVDYGILGEGEEVTFNLLNAIQNGEDVSGILGIAYKKDGKYIKTPEAPRIEDLDALPLPDYEGFEYDYYLDNFEYEDQKVVLQGQPRKSYVTGSRDCPAKCTFCFRTMGGDYVTRSVDNVIEEIKYLQERFDVNQIELNDEIFSVNKSRVYEFCDKIEKLKIPWSAQIRVNMINEKLIRRMKEAGCSQISYGLESASRDVLKSMQKGVRVEQIENALEVTRDAKITIQGNWIFGDPLETPETVRETIEFNRKHLPYLIHLDFLLAYPGTPMYFDALGKGLVKDRVKFYESGKNEHGEPVNVTSMSLEDFNALGTKLEVESRMSSIFGETTQASEKNGKYQVSIICPYCEFHNKDLSLVKRAYGFFTCTCRSCYQRFRANDMDMPKYRSPLKRYYKLFKKAVANTFLFLISLQFEPNMYKNKPLWMLLVPIRETVSFLKINTLIMKGRRFRKKTKKDFRQKLKTFSQKLVEIKETPSALSGGIKNMPIGLKK
jgi:anaerobic magnesium-protoporphyrin IX monomethyl ester cyclase